VFDPQKRHRSVLLFFVVVLTPASAYLLECDVFLPAIESCVVDFIDKDPSTLLQTSLLYKDCHLTNTRIEIDAEESIYSLDLPNYCLGLLRCIARHLCSLVLKHTTSQ
jgi:hypothetical protein